MIGLARAAWPVTPSDTVDLVGVTTAGLWVGGAGAITLTTTSGQTVTLASVPTGLLPILVKRVWNTGTTASAMVGLQL
jgi:hypothetical protein